MCIKSRIGRSSAGTQETGGQGRGQHSQRRWPSNCVCDVHFVDRSLLHVQGLLCAHASSGGCMQNALCCVLWRLCCHASCAASVTPHCPCCPTGPCEPTLQAEAAARRAATLVYSDAELMVELVPEEELQAAFATAGAGECCVYGSSSSASTWYGCVCRAGWCGSVCWDG
jgi:hypothetical protein